MDFLEAIHEVRVVLANVLRNVSLTAHGWSEQNGEVHRLARRSGRQCFPRQPPWATCSFPASQDSVLHSWCHAKGMGL